MKDVWIIEIKIPYKNSWDLVDEGRFNTIIDYAFSAEDYKKVLKYIKNLYPTAYIDATRKHIKGLNRNDPTFVNISHHIAKTLYMGQGIDVQDKDTKTRIALYKEVGRYIFNITEET